MDFGSARVGTGIVTVGAVGAAATSVARGVAFATGVFGRSAEAGTDVGALPAFAVGFAGSSTGGAAFVIDLEVTFGGADLDEELFDVTFGGAFESLEDDGFAGALTAPLGCILAFAPFASGFAAAFDLTEAFDAFDLADVAFETGLTFEATFAFAAGFVFATALPFAEGLAGVFFVATFIAFVTFVDFPPTLLGVAVLAFFAVANLISSAVFLLFSLPPVAGGGISKTRKSTETIGQKQRINR